MEDRLYPAGTLAPCDLAPNLYTGRLANGLKVVIRQDRRSPLAVCNIWVGVGSNREPEALRGWSHGIEHMLFKGTTRRGERDFALEVAAAGGSTNAGTGYETTNYHITLPTENLAAAVDILGDALLQSTFDPAALDAEREVLVHENHMYDDIPFGFGVTWRWGLEMTFDRSPYHYPIGGRDENLLERSRDDIVAFWRSAYRPDNMIAVIVGDVDPAAAFALLDERFGEAAGDPPASDPAVSIVAEPETEPPHAEPRLRIEHGDLQKAYAKLIFPAPGERAGLEPVLGVVRRVLSDGRSCRLYRRVQEEQQLIDDFAVMNETGPREGVFLIDLETDPERLGRALLETVRVLAELQRNSCTDSELERATRRAARGFLFGSETVQGQASNLGHHAMFGDLAAAFEFPRRIAAVTRDDVAAFCRAVLRLSQLNCVIYLPNGVEPSAVGLPDSPAALAALLAPVLDDDDVTLPRPRPAVTASDGASGRSRGPAPRFVTSRLDNGCTVQIRVDTSVPVAALAFSVRGGSCRESAATAGLTTLTAMAQVKGAGGLDSQTLHERLESEGASLGPHADRDYTGMFLTSLTSNLDAALDLTGRVLCRPDFAQAEIDQEIRLARQQLAALADNPVQAAVVRMRELLYGDHPYGRPLPGLDASLSAMTRDQVVARHMAAWHTGNLEIMASGDVDPDALLERLAEILSDLPSSQPPAPPAPGPGPDIGGIVRDEIQRDQNQAVVLAGWPAPHADSPHRVPIMLLREVLNGQSGRLFESLRNRRSLCYNTGVMSSAGFGPGMFVGYVLTAPDSRDEALQALLAELVQMTEETVPVDEFVRAQTQLSGGLLIGAQANAARAAQAAHDRIYGRDANDLVDLVQQVRACTPEQVRQAARAVIDAARRVEVVLGP